MPYHRHRLRGEQWYDNLVYSVAPPTMGGWLGNGNHIYTQTATNSYTSPQWIQVKYSCPTPTCGNYHFTYQPDPGNIIWHRVDDYSQTISQADYELQLAADLPDAVERFAREENQRNEEQRRCLEHAQEEYARMATAAESRADQLLFRFLSAEQKQMYTTRGFFIMRTERHRYRIRRGRTANVDVLDEKNIVLYSLCAHPELSVPDSDTCLAQKLMLETEEERFHRIANRHPARNAGEVIRS